MRHGVYRFLSRPKVVELTGRALKGIYRNRIRSGGCVIDANDQVFSPWVRSMIFWGLYESAELQLINRYLPATLDVVELGGSLGVVSAHIGRCLEPGRQLVSVEANPALMHVLRANLTSNAPHVRASTHNLAVCSGPDRPEFVEMSFGESSLAAWITHPGDAKGSCQVPSVALSDLLAWHEIGSYALISDIEGAEAGLFLSERDCASELPAHHCGIAPDQLARSKTVGPRPS